MNDLQAINGLSLGVHSTNGVVVSATGSSILNPTSGTGQNMFSRWDQINQGTLGSAGSNELLSNANAVFVSGGNFLGLDGGHSMGMNGTYVSQGAHADGSNEAIVGSFLVGSITLSANALGTTDLFLNNGSDLITYESGLGGFNIQFGAGDPQVVQGLIASSSQLADATITVVPEPVGIVLERQLRCVRCWLSDRDDSD